MSKYIKLEDAIRKYAEMIADEAYWEHGVGNGKPDEEDLDIAREYYSDLPTIEVSEDCISREDAIKLIKHIHNYADREGILRELETTPSVLPKRSCYRCGLREDCEDSAVGVVQRRKESEDK